MRGSSANALNTSPTLVVGGHGILNGYGHVPER
jgi:hypothetical protein